MSKGLVGIGVAGTTCVSSQVGGDTDDAAGATAVEKVRLLGMKGEAVACRTEICKTEDAVGEKAGTRGDLPLGKFAPVFGGVCVAA